MADPFLAEIRLMSCNFAPRGWALCNGQLLPINQNQALFSLMGTTYGGDGRVNFGLPDLRGRTPIHMGVGHTLGERGGAQAHTISIAEMPQHTHVLNASATVGSSDLATGKVLAEAPLDVYRAPTSLRSTAAGASLGIGGSQAHLNMQPFLAINFCVALQGIFPSQT